jgi:BlaI family transcriptional regulator, penicillinase repressor
VQFVNSLGDLERAVMEQLWTASGPQSVRDVHAVLMRRRDLAYTTVMTVLDRLTKKGLALRERDGRAYRYSAAQSREQLVAEVMHTALAEDPEQRTAALVAFVGRVSPADAEAMRTALDRLENSGRAENGSADRRVAAGHAVGR